MARRALPGLVLVGLVGVSTALRGLVAARVPSPWFTPDELVYAALGESIVRTGRFEILGSTPDFFGLVYPAFVGVPLVVAGIETGYELLKPLQALVMSLTAVPVYLWGRSLMAPRYALLAAVLTLAVPGLAYSGFLMTEVAFYPVLTCAAWAMARALARPTLEAQAALLAMLVVAVLTRLQALALVAVFGLALALQIVFTRGGLRGVRPFAPLGAGLAALALGWIVVTVLGGGHLLGAYGVTSERTADASTVAWYVLYHAADVLLLTALLPMLSLAVLVWAALRRREREPGAVALLAVAVALTVVSVAQVGVFAASWVGHVAERNLLGLAPPLFLVFALWLARGAPRRTPAWIAFVLAFVLLVVVPWDELAVLPVQPDAFSLIPLVRLVVESPEISIPLTVISAALPLGTAWLLVPRRFAWTLGVVLVALFAAASVVVNRTTTYEAKVFQAITVGVDKRWIDTATRDPVGFLYAGERNWSAGAPVWVNLFWNERIERVYTLFGQRIAGPMPTQAIAVDDAGRVLVRGRPAGIGQLAMALPWTIRGHRIATSSAGYHLWRAEPPLRFSTRVTGARITDLALGRRARLSVFDCDGGYTDLSLLAIRDSQIELRSPGRPPRKVAVAAGRTWSGRVPLMAPRGRRICQFDVVGGGARLTWFAPQRR